MKKIDLRKDLKHLYAPSAKKVEIVNVPELKFVMVDGRIEPGETPGTSQAFQNAIGALYELPVKYDVNQINNKNYHIIGGNLMKFRRFKGIFYDNKEESTRYQSHVYSLLNKIFVFSNI